MRKIRKRVFAAVLTAALLFTMPGMASYAEAEDAQTKDISESVTVQAEDDAAEETAAETEVIQEPETEDSDTNKPENGEGDTEDTETDAQEPAEEDTVPTQKEDAGQEDTGAQDDSANLCAHHKEHTQDCGYRPVSEDEAGSPCTYECHICPIEDLIDALPDEVTEDNRAEVESQLQELLALYTELTEEEQDQVDVSRCLELQAELDAANEPLSVAGETFTLDGNLTINSSNLSNYNGKVLTGTTNSANRNLTISGVTVHLTIQDLSLTIPHGSESKDQIAGISLTDNATLYLTLKGTNTITGGNMYAAIQVPAGCKLVITEDSTGSLTAKGGMGAAGIGSAWGGSTETNIMTLGSIEIKGGTVSAFGSNGAAGIGGTQRNFTGSIAITGGTVYAEGGYTSKVIDGINRSYGGAGIGGGFNGYVPEITITGGNVTAKAGYETAACIGAGTEGYVLNNGEMEFHYGNISITGGNVKTDGKIALGNNKSGEGNITLSDAATLHMSGDIRPMPQGWERYTFNGKVFDTAITGAQTAAEFSMGGKTYNITIDQDTSQPYSGNFSLKTFMPTAEPKEARLVCGGNSYTGTPEQSGNTFSFTFGQQKYAYYSLNCRIYDEAITANMDVQVAIEGVTTSAALTKTAEYCGDIQVNKLILPIEAKDRSSAVTVTAGNHTWTGTASAGTEKTLTVGFPILPAAMVLDLYYGDITFEKIGGNVQVTYTEPDKTEATTVFLADLSKVYEVIQSNADTPTAHRLIIKSTTEPVHIRIRDININTSTNSPIQITSGKAILETSGTNTVTATGEYTAAVYAGSGSALTLTGTGTLTARSTNNGYSGAGIGASGYKESSGEITIQSGTIIAESAEFAAGIGGGNEGSGTVTITGGTVTAFSGNRGAGIGGGFNGHGTVTITGGTVTATGGQNGSGIGGGAGSGATVHITGGIVTANGKGYGCGIGSGRDASAEIRITGGTIKASAGTGNYEGSGIGSGDRGTSTVTITGGTIQASGRKAAVEKPKDGGSGDLKLVTITLDNVGDQVPVTSVSGVGNYGLNDVYTSNGGKLYFYLPESILPESITLNSLDYVPDSAGSTKYIIDLLRGYPLARVYDGNAMANPTAAQVNDKFDFNALTFAWYHGATLLTAPPADAGSYTLKVSDSNVTQEYAVEITKKPLTITAKEQTIDYQTSIAQDAYTHTELAEGERLTVTLASTQIAPGTYLNAITASAEITRGGVDVTGNYEITYVPGNLTINAFTGTVGSWPEAGAITYGQALKDSTLTGGTASVAGSFAWEDGSVIPDRTGQHSYAVKFTPDDTNIEPVTQEVSVTVNKALLAITAKDQIIKHGAGIETGMNQVTASGLVNGDILAAVQVSTSAGTAAGVYENSITVENAKITHDGVDVTANYQISYAAGTLTIRPDLFYLDCDENGKNWTEKKPAASTEITNQTSWTNGTWYVVYGDITINNRITVGGSVHLILTDSSSLTAKKGITVNNGSSLTIYAQSTGSSMGKLIVPSADADCAGIGGSSKNAGGTITINGGNITAKGGSSTFGAGAGIGGGYKGDGGTVIINGGKVTAASGSKGAAGIGGGREGNGETVIINGGKVVATGGSETFGGGAGIGGGYKGTSDTTSGGIVRITGGTITANGGGSGKYVASGIGNGYDGSGGTVTIIGGTIHASGGTAVENPTNGSQGLKLVEIPLKGAKDNLLVTSVDGISGYGLNDVYTSNGGKLYFYLPEGTDPTSITSITAGGREYRLESGTYVTDFTVEWKDYPLTKIYDGTPLANPTEAQVDSNVDYRDLKFSWTLNGTAIDSPVNVGEYVLTVSGEGSSTTFDVKITKRPLTIAAEAQTIDYDTGIAQEKYTQSGLAEGDSLTVSLTTDKTTAGAYTGGITISSVQITRDGEDVTENYEITYTPGDLTIRKIVPSVSSWPTAAAITYGQALSESSLTGGDTNGTFAWKDDSIKPNQAGQYSYDVIFTPADSNYETVTQAVSVTVNKAAPDIGIVSAGEMNDTLDVSQVVLSRTNQTPAGTLTLADSTLQYGTHTYKWQFTPDDIVNYVPVTGAVQITVNDTIAPTAEYQIGTDGWKKFINTVSFGLFCKDYRTVTIRGTDDTDTVTGSGIVLTQYYISDQEMTDTGNIAWNTYTGPVSLNAQGTYFIYVKVTDNAGNTAVLNSEGIVIYAESTVSPAAFDYTYRQNQDCTVQLAMNGNTFKELTDNEGNAISTDHYTIDGNGTITLKAAYLDTLGKGGYTYKVSMNPQGIETDQVTLVYTFTVNVKAKELTVTGAAATGRAYNGTNTVEITTVTISGAVPGDDVAVDLSGVQGTLSSANAGTYSSVTLPELTLTGADKGNYTLVQPTGAVAASVTVTPLDAAITVGTDTYNKTFGDAAFTLDVTDNNTEADVQYEVTAGADVISVSNGTVTIQNAGTAAITVSLPASTNYNAAASKTITVSVAKKGGYTVAEMNRSYLYSRGNTDSIDLAALLPKDCGNVTYGTPAASGDVTYSVVPAVNDGKLSYTLNSGEINAEGTITVTVETRNYTDITITVKVKLTDQIPVSLKTGTEVPLENNVLTYGEPLSKLKFNKAEFVGDDGKTVEGIIAWRDASEIPDAGTASATWVFTPTDKAYASVEGMAAITVNKAVPAVSAAPTVAGRVYDPSITLKDDKLSGATVTGVGGNTLEGTWSWQSANIVPTVNNSGYVAVFTPKDTTNYETVTRTITVTVTKAVPYIAELPAAAAVTYGETLKDSLLSGGTVVYGNGAGQEGDKAGSTETVAGAFTWKEPSTKPVAADSNVTEFAVVFTPSDTANYNPVEAKVRLTVNKAQNAPNMPGSTMSVSNSIEKVGSVPLPAGWEWQASDKDTALEAGVAVSAVAVYTGADKGNYENETVTVAITRSSCDHVAGDVLYTGEGEKAPTCTEDGLGHRECTVCGAVMESGIVVEALKHTGGTATCSKRAVCTRCNQPYGDTNSNIHGGNEVRGFVAATCTAGGYTGDTYCKDCGAKTGAGNATPALGHDYTGRVTEEPTTESEGTRTYTCTRCRDSYKESIPRLPEETHGHSYTDRVTKEPTCTDTGVRTYTCTCGDSYTETIAALGHHYLGSETQKPTTTAEGVMTYTCDRCGHSYTRPIAKLPGDDATKPGSSQPGDTEPDSGNTEETRWEPGMPFIKGEDGKVGWEVIRAEEEQAKEGSIINVDMNGTTVVPGDIFDSIKGRDITITFDMGGGIIWSVDGKSVTRDASRDKAGDIDFSVKTGINSIPVDIVNNVTGERYSIQISLAHEGEFGFTAVLSINLGKENAGHTASLYYYNEGTGELEFICADEVAKDGTASLAFTHASDYVIVIDGDEGESGITESAQPESTEGTAGSNTTAQESSRTGQAGGLWWIIVAILLTAAIGTGTVLAVRKKGKDE